MEDVQSDNKNSFYAKFSDKEYYYRLNLYNNEGDIVFLKKNAVLSLVIEDNLFNPFHSGEIIISNDMYVLESCNTPYRFLGNGRDILDIEIIPIATGDFDADSKNEEIKKFLGMRFQFVITESTDVILNNTKCKRLTLTEYAEYMLTESMVDIFSIQNKMSETDYLDTNTANSTSTGELIKILLKVVYGDDDMIGKDDNGEDIFEMDDDSRLNLNPYNSMNYYDLLMYILQFHTYKSSPCVLNFDRYSKKFELISLNTLFSNNETFLQEALYFGAGGDDTKKVAIQWDASRISFKESSINEFFTDSPTSKYNITFNSNSSLLNVSTHFKTMLFDLKTLNSNNFTKTYFDLFCKPFENLFSSYQIVPNFYLSPNKNNNYHTHESSLPPELDQKRFLNKKLQSLLYLNNVHQITLDGLTNRQPMTFVDIIKYSDGASEPTEWDYANVGRHLITSVKHIFTQDGYKNIIETVKPYRLVNKKSGPETLQNLLNNFGS